MALPVRPPVATDISSGTVTDRNFRRHYDWLPLLLYFYKGNFSCLAERQISAGWEMKVAKRVEGGALINFVSSLLPHRSLIIIYKSRIDVKKTTWHAYKSVFADLPIAAKGVSEIGRALSPENKNSIKEQNSFPFLVEWQIACKWQATVIEWDMLHIVW